MRKLIALMDAEDEQVSYMATVAVLDTSGVKPIDYDPNEEKTAPPLDLGKQTYEERDLLKAMFEKLAQPLRSRSGA